jgi:hypothetical protein
MELGCVDSDIVYHNENGSPKLVMNESEVAAKQRFWKKSWPAVKLLMSVIIINPQPATICENMLFAGVRVRGRVQRTRTANFRRELSDYVLPPVLFSLFQSYFSDQCTGAMLQSQIGLLPPQIVRPSRVLVYFKSALSESMSDRRVFEKYDHIYSLN